MNYKPVNVTRPFLPPLEEFHKYLEKIWDNHVLTNGGPFHQELEQKLCEYLGVKYISLFANGTLALVTALQALKITGEVITSPFSFVATTHALWWNNIKPVFVDIEPETFTLDPSKIEAAITQKTTAILPVHVYGNPCKVYQIEKIANTNNLKVIYDACHSFGTKLNGESIVKFGDLSILSFHATKVFNTFEGGAIICHDEQTKKYIDQLKNFGFTGETSVVTIGINAKMNEFQAALGILQLKYLNDAILKRKEISQTYRKFLKSIPGVSFLNDLTYVNHNYAYFPIRIDSEIFGRTRDQVYEEFKQESIFVRRYFYPLISQFPIYQELESSQPGLMSVAEKVTEEIICLPIYPDLSRQDIKRIVKVLQSNHKNKTFTFL